MVAFSNVCLFDGARRAALGPGGSRIYVCLFVHGTGPRHRNDLVSGRLALASSRARSDLYWNGECLRSPPVGWCDVTPP